MATVECRRYHDISCGHRVFGHESKCAHLHGHNYRIHFHAVSDEVDHLGRVVDFSVLKSSLCEWLESTWDHRTLIYAADPWANMLPLLDPDGIVIVPFNPTAEAMAKHLCTVVGPQLLAGLPGNVRLVSVIIEETRKCSAAFTL